MRENLSITMKKKKTQERKHGTLTIKSCDKIWQYASKKEEKIAIEQNPFKSHGEMCGRQVIDVEH